MTPASLQFDGLEVCARFEHAAMATTFVFHLRGEAVNELRAAADEAFRLVDRLEDQLSFYREGSDVSRINRARAGETVRVQDGTMACLLTALEVAAASDGAFDPFAGAPALAAKGQPVPAHLHDTPADDPPGTPCVAVDPAAGTITKLAGRRWLDLGAVGKGFALDAAAELLREWGVEAGLLVAGGSSVVGFGAGPADDGSWTLHLRGAEGERTLALRTPFGLGASGEGFQPGHIIRTAGDAATAPLRAYALAATGAVADALSTALWALPPERRATLTEPWPEASIMIEPRRAPDRPVAPAAGTGVFAATPPVSAQCLVVIPCWRESRRLPRFLPALCAAVKDSALPIEVAVVDDGSEEPEVAATARLVERVRANFPLLRPLVRLVPHGGKGAAILRGWQEVPPGCPWIGFVDADGAVPAAEVVRLARLALERPATDCVIAASRRHHDPDRPVHRPMRRAWIGTLFSAWSRWRLRHDAVDPQCGCKILPARFAADTPWSQHGYALDLELLLAARRAGLCVVNVPIAWHETPGSKLRARDLFSMLQSIERLRITARASAAPSPASTHSTPP